MAYKFSETNKVNDKFAKVFGIGFKPFYDGLVSVATKQLWIDIVKFDEWLQKKHGDYDGKSMNDVIREHYGDEGVRLVNALTGEDEPEGPKGGIVERDGITTVAERTVKDTEVTYKPYGNYHKGLDVNQVVYDLMTIAAQDMLSWGTAVYGGNWTAAEMAGKAGYLHQFVEGDGYKLVSIKTDTFCCTYHASEAFSQMAEWEGVMNLAPKKYHRFAVEGKELPKDVKIKAYQRCHGYKPKTISLTAENDRIAKKFEVLGPMYEVLGSEGMKKALSVLTAIRSIEKLHGYGMGERADRLLRRKFWKDYGKCEPLHRRIEWLKQEAERMKQNGEEKSERAKKMNEEFKALQQKIMMHGERFFVASDFEHAPEAWKVVDRQYVEELIAYFRQVLKDYPAPEWPKKNDHVQLKNQEKQPKKWQGKLGVYEVRGQLDYYQDKIVWYAEVHTTKGKYDCTRYGVDALEPWVEPAKTKKKVTQKAQKSQKAAPKTSKPKAKETLTKVDSYTVKDDAGKDVTFGSYVPNVGYEEPAPKQEPTLAEKLREALLKQMQKAA